MALAQFWQGSRASRVPASPKTCQEKSHTPPRGDEVAVVLRILWELLLASPLSTGQGASSMVTLVLGGVRSGKSRYAQQLAERAECVLFVATAEVRDDPEMSSKIERHRAERPNHWTTIEEPIELARVLTHSPKGSQAILIDCLTIFAANMLERFGEDTRANHAEVEALCSALVHARCPVILVSNEVGSGVVPAYALGRRFRDLVGEINQRVATIADNVVLMVAGLPLALKGDLQR
jgi:adenosylcobinamide kinase/adenosylcobinamide-phosphate guanylyltransferase